MAVFIPAPKPDGVSPSSPGLCTTSVDATMPYGINWPTRTTAHLPLAQADVKHPYRQRGNRMQLAKRGSADTQVRLGRLPPKEPLRRWAAASLGATLGAIGGSAAALTSNMPPPFAILGGAMAGTAGLAAGVLLDAASRSRQAALDLQAARQRRARMGVTLPVDHSTQDKSSRPSDLLSPHRRLVPFRGRMKEMASLSAWLTGSVSAPIMILRGTSGVGKTRMIVESAHRHQDAMTFLHVGPSRIEGLLDTLVECADTTIVTLDLHAPNENLGPLLEGLGVVGDRVRLLMECRTEAWMDSIGRTLNESTLPLLTGAARIAARPVGDPDDLKRWYAEAVHAVNPEATISVTTTFKSGTTMLALQGQAVAVALEKGAVDPTSSDTQPALSAVARHLLEHERRAWVAPHIVGAWSDEVATRSLLCLWLTGPDDEEEASDNLQLVPDLADASEERRREIVRWAHRIYPGQLVVTAVSSSGVMLLGSRGRRSWRGGGRGICG